MSIEALLKAILVLHQGGARQYALMKYSVAKQIKKNDIQTIDIDNRNIQAMEMIITVKYTPFAIEGDIAKRTIEALVIDMTTEGEVLLVMQTNTTQCPVENGQILIEAEKLITQENHKTSIEEYARIHKDFEIYIEEDE